MATISSVHDLQMIMPRLLEKHGNDSELAFIALANPLAALEKLGYTITEDAKFDLENYARFGKKGFEKYKELQGKIFTLTGQNFNLKNDNETASVLEKLINKGTKAGSAAKKTALSLDIRSLVLSTPTSINNKWTDSLKTIIDAHPVIPVLIELRKLENSAPKFADASTLQLIQQKKEQTPLRNISFRLSRKNIDKPGN
ncbi:MAG: hypothetical protein ABI204_03150 [Ginsengibacter sp.]